jgi:hypothetical protein
MKIANNLIAAVCLLIPAVATQAADASRTARIEDTSGVKTEVSDLKSSFETYSRQAPDERADDCVHITVPYCEVAIPTSCLLSITSSGGLTTVTYQWRGQQRTISGALDANFAGQSDFGTFELSSAKLRQLIFNGPSAAADLRPPGPQGQFVTASVVLKNGTALVMTGLQRQASYYSSEGYIVGGATRHNHYADFRFLRGESLTTVAFAAIRKLEFSGEDAVSVTLKNGHVATGKLSDKDDARLDGWTGETDQGLAFVAPASVRAVEFGDITSKGTP